MKQKQETKGIKRFKIPTLFFSFFLSFLAFSRKPNIGFNVTKKKKNIGFNENIKRRRNPCLKNKITIILNPVWLPRNA
jgi:hypothetical protein